MKPGDAKILRNAGARVTDDVLRTLVLASYLLGVKRILVMPHTDCRMANGDEADIHNEINNQYGIDTSSIEFKTVKDQKKALLEDIQKIRNFPLLNQEVVVGGAIYNVGNGKLEPLDA
jgi:carbonic anhydrase